MGGGRWPRPLRVAQVAERGEVVQLGRRAQLREEEALRRARNWQLITGHPVPEEVLGWPIAKQEAAAGLLLAGVVEYNPKGHGCLAIKKNVDFHTALRNADYLLEVFYGGK